MTHSATIIQTEVYKFLVPLKAPFITSLGREENAENIIIVIRTDKGISGFGECNPFMPINGESIDTAYTVAGYFGKALKGKNALDVEECIQSLNRVIYANYSIKSAFDIALHDIAAQFAGVPLYKFLGGKKNHALYTDYTVSIGEIDKMVYDAIRIKDEGFPAIKIKLGDHAQTDIARVKAIRESVGKEIPLRLDANQGWTPEEAIEVLEELKQEHIQYCEEPIARRNYLKLQKVKKRSPIPVMADESCCDHFDAKLLISLKACDMFNIKMGKAGSLITARKILRLAEKEKMDVQIGAFMESRLGMTAFAHLALSSHAVQYCDFDTPLMHAVDFISGGLTYHENGMMKVPDTPGLGASIEPEMLNKMEKVVI
ncbi:MAG: dipeptide epimerase [Terrimonas sp.]|nr:dipeptide epimerase [Terrimonas sp.]